MLIVTGDTADLTSDTATSDIHLDAASGISILLFHQYKLNGTSQDDNFDLSGIVTIWNQEENIDLGAGNDVYEGSRTADKVTGNSGNDTLNGNDGDDTLVGGTGNDLLDGGDGKDRFLIAGEAGSDTIRGGNGYDTLRLTSDAIVSKLVLDTLASVETINIYYHHLDGTASDDSFDLSGVTEILYQAENIDLGAGNDIYRGSSATDKVTGDGGNDTLSGNDGDDTLVGGAGNDSLDGGDGKDRFEFAGEVGFDTIRGGNGYDTLRLTGDTVVSNLILDTLASVETLAIYSHHLDGTASDDNFDLGGVAEIEFQTDIIDLGAGNDAYKGSSAGDKVTGNTGNDTLIGNDGNDTLNGGDGNDRLDGGEGIDIFAIEGNSGTDIFRGGSGFDTVFLTGDANLSGLSLDSLSEIETLNLNYYNLLGTDEDNIFDVSGVTAIARQSKDIDLGAGADSYIGGIFEDRVAGGSGNDTLRGNDGNDTLIGGTGDDSLDGGNGVDFFRLEGSAGTDTFRGGNGFDYLELTGDTTLSRLSLNSVASVEAILANVYRLDGTAGDDNFDLRAVTQIIYQSGYIDLGSGIDVYEGSSTTDKVTGNTGNDTLSGNDGNDILVGGEGNDSLNGGEGADLFLIEGNAGTDTFQGGNGFDTLELTGDIILSGLLLDSRASVEFLSLASYQGNNFRLHQLTGTSGDDIFDLSGVTEILDQAEIIDLDDGNDIYRGSKNSDSVTGGGGNDILNGNDGNDTLVGGAGNDRLDGGAGKDSLSGGKGNDTYIVDSTKDIVFESKGSGIDFVYSSISYSLDSNLEKLILTGLRDISGTGNNLANAISGNARNNILSGGKGNDTLSGGSGNDTLIGGIGSDLLKGGRGADNFKYTSLSDSSNSNLERDKIIDFSHKEKDLINLSTIDAIAGKAGNQSFTFIGMDEFSKEAGELRVSKSIKSYIISGDINGDGNSDFSISVSTSKVLVESDFIL